MLNPSGQPNLICFTTNLSDKGCVAEFGKVFALVSHENLIKEVVLRANKTWPSRQLCLSWLIDGSTIIKLDYLFTLHISTQGYYFFMQVFQNDKHAVIFNYSNYSIDSEIIESDS